MRTYRLSLLGTPQITGPGESVRLLAESPDTLLCFLAAQPMRLFTIAQLEVIFGPGTPDAVRRLQERLPVWPVRQQGSSLGWDTNAGVAVDTSLFRELVGESSGNPTLEALRAAVGLWRGPFMEGAQWQGNPAFNEWLDRKRLHWKDWVLETAARLNEWEQHAGRGPGVASAVRQAPEWAASAADLQIIAKLAGHPVEAIMSSTSLAMGALLIRDSLTGLYNRQYLQRRLTMELKTARELGQVVALMMMDLDDFKRLNDSFGHAAGDSLIKAVGETTARQVGGSGVVARYGGDEFVIALFHTDQGRATELAARLVEALAGLQIRFDGDRSVQGVRCSLGIAFCDSDGSDYAELFEAADRAMYHAKQRLGGGVCLSATLRAGGPALDVGLRPIAPRGVVTFVICEPESFTAENPAQVKALTGCEAFVSSYMERSGGLVFRSGYHPARLYAAFASARDALTAARALQQAWLVDPQLTVASGMRVAVHTGQAEFSGAEYSGAAVRLGGHLAGAAHGGQILLSEAAAEQLRAVLTPDERLRDLGTHRLRDLQSTGTIYQLECPALAGGFRPPRTLTTLPTNLPSQLSSFVGRDGELAEVREYLRAARLLTLSGPGGAGKTRLALQAAAEAADRFAGGVWLVELAALDNPGQVLQAVAEVTGMRDLPGPLTVGAVAEFLAGRRLLVVLDNCEHLLAACADLAGALLHACEHLCMLATSREPLGIAGEIVWRVPSLALPDPDRLPALEELAAYDGVQLFVQRARLSKPAFALTTENALALVQLCQRLDGIPLALELAAARSRSLTVDEILSRLDDRFGLLTGGSRSALPRQQTLRALVDWSYDLLSAPERVLWRRVSVFAGGFSLAAAEEVCSGDGVERAAILDLVAQLVDRSIVLAEGQQGETRYRLLETIREYGAQRLEAAGEQAALCRRHRDWYLAYAEAAGASRGGPEEVRWFNRLDGERENLWAALRWSRRQGEAEPQLRMAVALTWFWTRRHVGQGRAFIEELLQERSVRDFPSLLAAALHSAGSLASYHGDHQTAIARWAESMALRRRLGETDRFVLLLNNMGFAATQRGDYERAKALLHEAKALDTDRQARGLDLVLGRVFLYEGNHEQAIALFKETLRVRQAQGDRYNCTHAIASLGLAAWYQGDLPKAQELLEEAVEAYTELGDQGGLALNLTHLAQVVHARGDLPRAAELYGQGLRVFANINGGLMLGEPECLEGVAALLCDRDDPGSAAQLLGAVERIRDLYGLVRPTASRPHYEGILSGARRALREDGFRAAFAQGARMSLQKALRVAWDHLAVLTGTSM